MLKNNVYLCITESTASCLFILMQDIRHCLFIPARPVIQSAAYAGSFGKSLEHTIIERQNACSARTLQGSHLERGHVAGMGRDSYVEKGAKIWVLKDE